MTSKNNEDNSFESSGDSLVHTMEDDLKGPLEVKPSQEKQEKFQKPVFTPPVRPTPPVPPLPPAPPTSEKKDNLVSFTGLNRRDEETNKSYSPFLNTSDNKETPKTSNEQLLERPPKESNWKKIIVGSTIFLTILALAGGGYYFWITRKVPQPLTSDTPVVTPGDEIQNEETGEPVYIEPQTQKYTLEKPNYLTIDTETANKQKIQEDIIVVASELKDLNLSAPVEFIVVDKNNNPIAFPIFSILTDIKLGPVLDFLEEGFSLYFYNDAGEIRMALVAEVKDKTKAEEAMAVKEKTLIEDISIIFLNSNIQSKGTVFKTGTSKKYPVRYVNLDDTGGLLSLDYSFTDKNLIISTSKNTTWTLLDKLSP